MTPCEFRTAWHHKSSRALLMRSIKPFLRVANMLFSLSRGEILELFRAHRWMFCGFALICRCRRRRR
ncbi:hypothetical protein HBH56_095250 [Parastagonospora nodorum]|uniref:Uncharacterized protein n=1 Tax=Phaeosphaeria nodorum (strain SN15 / ATCC MYA-4574 / FGSC 10173) TaxID=321614 RepID=A0A7U2NQX7_PHANO|nr:hypothetical protein HBH56_095250 [Parastagonospora nodorum]QRD07154.1 hypothetical protein JI435_424000 [Parastagonospora nodorum SN15]KAH3930168.1 hypothetical protein HBH54_109570 [Parastagonospora nodorum]KAH4070012.1 hypothetical protein HBH50_092860 [Parastagonospora nodorum]KAH4090578.1 hypothetical protein HBH48_096630 [Parastagonospora nodorum]